MSKYLITRTDDEGNTIEMTLEFSETGTEFLKAWTVNGEFDSFFWRALWRCPPLSRNALLHFQYDGTKIEEIPADLTFSVFWKAYGYKVGNKAKAEKLWDSLTDHDKKANLKAIPKYLAWLARKQNMEQAQATTWLNQRRWEGDYK